MKAFRLPKMGDKEVEDLIQEQMICRIAFRGDEYPYIAPFQYVFMNGSLYFHFTDYGRKMRLIEKDNRVCVEIESYLPDLSKYKFVVLRGSIKVVPDPHERNKVIERMAKEGEQKLSQNFLAAHGLKKEDGWSSFTYNESIVIVKLENIVEKLGLSSPK